MANTDDCQCFAREVVMRCHLPNANIWPIYQIAEEGA
jgi:hypothetical protein